MKKLLMTTVAALMLTTGAQAADMRDYERNGNWTNYGGIGEANIHAGVELNVAGYGIGESEVEGGDPGGMGLVADAVKELYVEAELFDDVMADRDRV